ncbi:hypothetical protein L915_03590 [Phytophthora nicotianae]|uniref:Uncharacterized protein n=1 Tax=Phytophthora nicotianae TaxID=4792 RepID=W2NVY7_PHYNI|nr:hypothetical protein L915_03590 [Phytophthora nicotianae]ETL46594.1 hypothetical protein L916_03536 [Phytophthora nicotianae]ETM52882.1 hypothetical protein L914_03563 [Phytophthora nicotianae]
MLMRAIVRCRGLRGRLCSVAVDAAWSRSLFFNAKAAAMRSCVVATVLGRSNV